MKGQSEIAPTWRSCSCLSLLLVFMTAALAGSPPALAAKKVRIELLSERADLVTGGTAIAQGCSCRGAFPRARVPRQPQSPRTSRGALPGERAGVSRRS